MKIENKLKHSFRPVLWLRQLATINFQRAKIDEYEEIIKDKLWEEFVKWKNEPSENERLIKENKRLRLQNKTLKEIIKKGEYATTDKKKR